MSHTRISFSYFLSYFPLTVSDAISCLLHNLNALWYIITRHACLTVYSDRSNLLCFFRILITPKKIVLREYFEWSVSYFGRDLY